MMDYSPVWEVLSIPINQSLRKVMESDKTVVYNFIQLYKVNCHSLSHKARLLPISIKSDLYSGHELPI